MRSPVADTGPALELDGVTKRYAAHTAVRELSLTVPRGTIYGILGPNGAGKTTTLRMIMDIILPDAGRIHVLGRDPEREPSVLERVGYLPEERGLYRKMRALEVVVFFGRLKGLSRADAQRVGREWLERMGLGDWLDARVETLSKGMQQKVQFVATVMHRPDLLILDEPQSGLDPVNQEVLSRTILDARAEGRTVLLSTHNMHQAQQMCDSVCIIAAGAKVLDGAVAALRREHRGNRYVVEFDEPDGAAERFMAESPLVASSVREGAAWRVELSERADGRDLLGAINALEARIARFEHVEPSLHEIFVHHVGASAPAPRKEVVHA